MSRTNLDRARGFWQGKYGGTTTHLEYLRRIDKRYLVFIFCNDSAFVVSVAILPILILSNVFSTQGIKYYCALQVGVTLDLLCLIGAYVARMFLLVGWVSLYVVVHVVVFLLQVFLAGALWQQALREKLKHCPPGWLKKLFGLSIDEPAEDDDDDKEEEAVIMEGKLGKRRKLLLLLAILATIYTRLPCRREPTERLLGQLPAPGIPVLQSNRLHRFPIHHFNAGEHEAPGGETRTVARAAGVRDT